MQPNLQTPSFFTRLHIVQESGVKKYMNNGGNFITGVDISSEVSIMFWKYQIYILQLKKYYRNQLKEETNVSRDSAILLYRVQLRLSSHWIS